MTLYRQEYYPGVRYVVATANPELLPLAVYEVVRGEFDNQGDAAVLQYELAAFGEDSQILAVGWIENARPVAFKEGIKAR